MERQQEILRRQEVITALEREEEAFFGVDGSHEFTEEGFQAAQASMKRKRPLYEELGGLNKRLGIQGLSRMPIEEPQ